MLYCAGTGTPCAVVPALFEVPQTSTALVAAAPRKARDGCIGSAAQHNGITCSSINDGRWKPPQMHTAKPAGSQAVARQRCERFKEKA